MNEPKVRMEQREVEVTLNTQELAQRGKHMAMLDEEISKLQNALEEAENHFNALIDVKTVERTHLRRAILGGKEFRMADVAVMPDWDNHLMKYYYGATVVDSRPMTSEEYAQKPEDKAAEEFPTGEAEAEATPNLDDL